MQLLLIEDDVLLSDGMATILRRANHEVDQAFDGHQADLCLQSAVYDVAILDLGLPGLDGSQVLQRLRKRGNQTPILVVSARDGVEERVRILDLGADHYLVKPVAMEELEASVRALGRRPAADAMSRVAVGRLNMDLVSQRADVDGQPLELTAREWEILKLLATQARRVVSKESILQSLYRAEEDVTANAVEVFVSRLRAKLEETGISIRTVRGLGYYLDCR